MVKIKETRLEILPAPLGPDRRKARAEVLRQNLETYSMQELVQRELRQFYGWAFIGDPVTRRLYRNMSIVYTRAELEKFIERRFQDISGDEGSL